MKTIKKIKPCRLITIGFASVIIIGCILLALPITQKDGVKVSLVDALFTSTSAVCVTGLIAVDTADSFNTLGKILIAILIQIGGLGITSVGVGVILLAGKHISIKGRTLIKEAMNLNSMKGIVKLLKAILLSTLLIESIGAVLSFLSFSKVYSIKNAIGISIFHSIASFNNSGFDIIGGFQNLIPFKKDVLLNLVTSFLIILGGLGFLVIKEIVEKRNIKKCSLHTKVVLAMTGILLFVGTVLLKITEKITWLGAFFFSVSARTAGFSTYNVGKFSNAGLFVLIILMFIGASPGSTGGGIKTTTLFLVVKNIYCSSVNKYVTAFKRRVTASSIVKAFNLCVLAVAVVCVNTLILCIIETRYSFIQILFEVVSALGTVGLSTGITPELCDISKIILTLVMFLGRIGPLTIASIWYSKELPNCKYSEESVIIG